MPSYAYLDLCFFERCNLTCTYCRTTNEGMLGSTSLEQLVAAVSSFLRHSSAAIFKVSGYGEVSLWPSLVEAVGHVSGLFPVVQIITNGTMAAAKTDALLEHENLVFCVTVDGDTLEANSHRTGGNAKIHRRIHEFVDRVTTAGRPIELNCVLTALNIERFPEYLRFVGDRHRDLAMVMPFPVRPFVGLETSPPPATDRQVERTFEQILAHYDDYSAVLPSRHYVERLYDFMQRRVRGWACFVPVFNYGVGPLLSPLACACLGHTKPSDDLFNLVIPEHERSQSDRLVDVSRLRTARIEKGHVDERCGTCFTHYEILNLFLEGTVGWEDIGRIPSFRSPAARAMLEDVRREIDLPSHTVGPVPAWKARSLAVVP